MFTKIWSIIKEIYAKSLSGNRFNVNRNMYEFFLSGVNFRFLVT